MNKPKYYLVEESSMPPIFLKVLQTKRILQLGKIKTINEAVMQTGISRSAYYKYKDTVFPFYEISKGKIITIQALLKDEPGILSNLLNLFAKAGANILTINQNIPVNGTANITVSMRTGDMRIKFDTLVDKMEKLDGVVKVEILASE